MHYVRVVALGLLFAQSSIAAPSASLVAHEKRELDVAHAHRWVKRSRAPAEVEMPVRIALTQQNLDRGHDLLMEISDPDSPKYGQHLTPEEIGDLFAPHDDSIAGVRSWLIQEGIHPTRHTLSSGKNYIQFSATISELEALLQTQYHVYTHTDSGAEHVGADEYFLPHHIKEHVDFITPAVGHHPLPGPSHLVARDQLASKASFPPPQQVPYRGSTAQSTSGDLSNCNAVVTIDCIRAMYSVPRGTTATPGNEIGNFQTNASWDQADLNYFFQDYAPYVPGGWTPEEGSINGGGSGRITNASVADLEPLLDMELILPLVYPQKSILYEVDDPLTLEHENRSGFADTFLDALDKSFCTYMGGDNKTIDPTYPDPRPGGYDHPQMCGTFKPPTVLSVSYGLPEGSSPRQYFLRQCHEFMKLGLAGTSAIFATGDNGVGADSSCTGTQEKPIFAPNFPASCPYVTAVGATQLKPGDPVDARQVAVNEPLYNGFASGGGFSNLWPRPAYQESAVTNYLAENAPPYPPGTYNKTGRGFPDVSAVGINIFFYYRLSPILAGGTSAAAPIFASLITLINEQRFKAGKKAVGFLNPTIYKNPQAFTDIVEGSNPGCYSAGFNTSAGWDPATGMGTPKYPELERVLMALP